MQACYFYAANEAFWSAHGMETNGWMVAIQYRDQILARNRTMPPGRTVPPLHALRRWRSSRAYLRRPCSGIISRQGALLCTLGRSFIMVSEPRGDRLASSGGERTVVREGLARRGVGEESFR